MAQALVAQEIQRAERLENKARQQVVLAGQWFAIAQAVLAVALNKETIDHRWLLWVSCGFGVAGGLALAATIFMSWRVWRLGDEHELTPAALTQMRDQASVDHTQFLRDLITHYASILQRRRARNATRADRQGEAEIGWLVTMGLPLLELGFAVAAVLFT